MRSFKNRLDEWKWKRALNLAFRKVEDIAAEIGYDDTEVNEHTEEDFARLLKEIEEHQQRLREDPEYAYQERKKDRKFEIYMFFHDWGTAKYVLLRPIRRLFRK